MVRSRDWVTRSTTRLPSSTEAMEPSISSLVALAASSDLVARFRTSSATTAKPLPAAPALAASTAALRARMLVWKAMFSMVAMILPICWEEAEICSIAVFSCPTYSTLVPSCAPAWFTKLPASSVALAVLLALSEISLMVAESSWTELACWVAPWARAWALVDTCSEPEETCSALSRIWRMVSLSLFSMLSIERLMEAKSPM